MIVNRYKRFDEVEVDLQNTPYIYWPLEIIKPLICKVLDKDKREDYLKWFERQKNNIIIGKETREFIDYFNSESQIPLFSSIELETINRCNGECPFCPVNRHDDTREFKKMDEELFKSIIAQLKELNYSGRLAFHSNNEPFLDKRIIDFVKYARQELPNTYIYMYNNGSLLTLDKFKEIIPHMDKMIIDNYNDELKLNPNPKIIHEYCSKDKVLNKKVEIHLRKVHEVLNTRGGQSPNNNKKKTLNISCVLPFKQVVIRPDGKISLCCNDPLGKFTMGDLTKNTFVEIWNSPKYKKLRKRLAKGRKTVSLCKYCDTLPGPKGY